MNENAVSGDRPDTVLLVESEVLVRLAISDDFMRVGIDAEMQFAPTPRETNTTLLIQPFALALDLQTSAVDEEMQWFVTTNRLW
jgi:hypothetical protein